MVQVHLQVVAVKDIVRMTFVVTSHVSWEGDIMAHGYVTGLWATVVSISIGSVALGQARSITRPMSETEYTASQLRADEQTSRAALQRIHAMADAGVMIDSRWLRILAEKGLFADVEILAVKGILNAPTESKAVAALQRARVEALLHQQGKAQEAIAAAKGYYNVALLKDAESAVHLLSHCLAEAYPDDNALLRRFRTQQVEWSTVEVVPAASEELGENVLKSIKITNDAFGSEADAIIQRDYRGYIARGNLLLLADRPTEAKQAFESAELTAAGSQETAMAVEGIARAIRAEAGALGPANAFIIAQQQAAK